MKSLDVRYFALLREAAGRDQETFALGAEATYADVYRTLATRHGFTLPEEMIKVAVNEEFANLHAPVAPGARVVFIPPVAGG